MTEAVNQAGVVRPHHPEATLKWVFSSQAFKIWLQEFLLETTDLSTIIKTELMA